VLASVERLRPQLASASTVRKNIALPMAPEGHSSTMKIRKKKNLPVEEVRRYLEPGPVVLVSSCWKGRANVMTMGWHTVMEFSPSLVGCIIAEGNYSHALIRKSGECVINIPTADMLDLVVDIRNCSGAQIDKFEKFGLEIAPAERVSAPLLTQCYANLECRLFDKQLIGKYDFFIFEVVQAHVAVRPKTPQTVHYTGDGVFMISGQTVSRRRRFRADML
jgi:flavin reductase (DIM6/NTAB) family NADH-FMN oxidoreductase RutF